MKREKIDTKGCGKDADALLLAKEEEKKFTGCGSLVKVTIPKGVVYTTNPEKYEGICNNILRH